jgi:hypothetical protein
VGLHSALTAVNAPKWEWREAQTWADWLYISSLDYADNSAGIQGYLRDRLHHMAEGLRQQVNRSGYKLQVEVEFWEQPPGSNGDPLSLPSHGVRARVPRYLWVQSDCQHDMQEWSYLEGSAIGNRVDGCPCGACAFRATTYDTSDPAWGPAWSPECEWCGEDVILVNPPEPTYIDAYSNEYYHLECWEEMQREAAEQWETGYDE